MTIHAMIETAMGVQNVFEIASKFSRIDAITVGGQDLTADMNIIYTPDGAGIDFARKTNCHGCQSQSYRCARYNFSGCER